MPEFILCVYSAFRNQKREGVRSVIGGCEPFSVGAGTERRSLEEQRMFLTAENSAYLCISFL